MYNDNLFKISNKNFNKTLRKPQTDELRSIDHSQKKNNSRHVWTNNSDENIQV